MIFFSERLSASANIYIVAFVDAVEGLNVPRKQYWFLQLHQLAK